MSARMSRYTHDNLNDDDADSINSIQLTEGITASTTHIRYHHGHNSLKTIWRQRTHLEKSLLVLILILLFILIVLIIVVHSLEDRISNVSTPPICLNKSCIQIADHILKSMDLDVDPCEDFYGYACNGWLHTNPVPDGKSTWGTFMKLEQENQMIIKKILEQPVSILKSESERKAKLYYESCLDRNDTVEKLGAEPMLNLLERIGGWNLTSNGGFNVTEWSLQNVLEIVQNQFNIGALFSYAIGEDDKNSSRHILQIDQSGLTLPTRDMYLNRTEHKIVLEAYYEYILRVGVLLGGNTTNMAHQIRSLIEFETRLANITIPNELRRDEEALYNLMTIGKLQQLADFIDWRRFFDNALKLIQRKITVQDQVVVYAPTYLQNLTQLINEYQRTAPGRIVLSNYVTWQTVKFFVGCLSKVFREAYKGLRRALMGTDGGEEAQWRYCIQDTTNVLGFAVGAIFVREVFPNPESKNHVEQMISNVRVAFIENFHTLDWMDPDTRRRAILKAEGIADMIAYPEYIKNPHLLDAKYEELSIGGDTYFENNLHINLYNLKRNLEKIKEGVNKTVWSMAPSTVNAYYTPTKNQMVLPAGILQNPFYDVHYPSSLNYGGIGVVMGHELTHGFDDQGREFDKDGNLNHWWRNETIERFKMRTQCFVDQYRTYQINGKRINGNQTLGENIADNGGLKAAYRAFIQMPASVHQLPGINLTDCQLFFVAFAQVWCSTVTKEALHLQLEKDSHSPAKYRVIGALSNSPAFAKCYQCPRDAPMNPSKKCDVW